MSAHSKVVLCLVVGALAMVAAAHGEEQCGVCHPEARVEAEQSVHAQEGVGCASCHGGDAESLDVDGAHRGDFRSLRDRQALPEHCGDCHSDLERMRPYNLPVDQYALYRTSQHGRALARGDVRAAVCTDCHGVHGISGPRDPQSPVYHRNVPRTCGRCHGDAELMASYSIDAGVVEDYRGSVHGNALLEAGNLAAPDCTSCHGVHGATPPGFGDVDKVCGSCHVDTRAAFREGPHHEAMLAAGLPECASCHSNHAIRRFDISSLDEMCVECHGDGSDNAVLGAKIRTLVEAAEEEIAGAQRLIEKAKRIPVDVQDSEGRVEEARTLLTETLPLVHSLSVDGVESVTRRARSIGEEVEHELYGKTDTRSKKVGLAVFWFYLLMTVAVLVTYRRRLRSS